MLRCAGPQWREAKITTSANFELVTIPIASFLWEDEEDKLFAFNVVHSFLNISSVTALTCAFFWDTNLAFHFRMSWQKTGKLLIIEREPNRDEEHTLIFECERNGAERFLPDNPEIVKRHCPTIVLEYIDASRTWTR
jgi:hypothetical protein